MLYIVTDIEADGGTPGAHSMIAFGSVAIRETGAPLGEFEGVLTPLPGATQDPRTMKWWSQFPQAFAAATANPRPAGDVMTDFVHWVKSFNEPAVFAAHPLGFDGNWMDYYLRRFTPYAIVQGFYEEDKLFVSSGLCLRSFAAAITARPVHEMDVSVYPKDWLGSHEHTHRAIDDARGYGSLLQTLFRLSHEHQRTGK